MFKAGVCALLLAMALGARAELVYKLDWEATGSSFFDKFDFITYDDPTNGFVNYINQTDAEGTPVALSLISTLGLLP